MAYNRWYFWDGRADSLWAQALEPIESAGELGGSRLQVARRIHDDPGVRRAYERLYGPAPDLSDTVEGLRAGDEARQRALSATARRGLKVFVGRGECWPCHDGPNFSDGEFHDVGVPPRSGGPPADSGRYAGAKRLGLMGAGAETWGHFKTPPCATWRAPRSPSRTKRSTPPSSGPRPHRSRRQPRGRAQVAKARSSSTYGRVTMLNRKATSEVHTIWSRPVSANQWNHYVLALTLSDRRDGGSIELWFNGAKQTFSNNSQRWPARLYDRDHVCPKWGVYGAEGSSVSNFVHGLKIGTTFADVD